MPHATAPPPDPAPSPHVTSISVIESCESAIEAIAAAAPTLKEAELRVLLELARRQLASGAGAVEASSRELAEACKASRRNVQYALDSLAKRCLITTRQGTATKAARYQVAVLATVRTVRTGGAVTTPPPGADTTPQVALFARHPGAVTTPPPDENSALTAAARRVDEFPTLPPILDRVLTCKPKDFDRADLETFRRWLHGYMIKFGRDQDNRPVQNPHPPDDGIVAQFLACGDPRRLGTLLDSLMLDKEPCNRYSWFPTVALQRLHGVTWQQTQAARAQLREARRGRPAEPQQDTLDLHEQIRAAAAKKAMP